MDMQTRVESFESAKVTMEYINNNTSLDLDSHFLVKSSKRASQAPVRVLSFLSHSHSIAWNNNIDFYRTKENYNEVSNQEFTNILINKFPKDDSLINKEENIKIGFPCPHLKWEGIWDYEGIGWRIEWTGKDFSATKINDSYCFYNWQPVSGWKQIEQGNQKSINEGKLSRPKVQKNQIKTPWDIYDE